MLEFVIKAGGRVASKAAKAPDAAEAAAAKAAAKPAAKPAAAKAAEGEEPEVKEIEPKTPEQTEAERRLAELEKIAATGSSEDIKNAAALAVRAREEAGESEGKKQLLRQTMEERGASPLPKGRVVNPVNVTAELLPILAETMGEDVPEEHDPGFMDYARLATLVPRVAASYGQGTETSRGQLFAPKISRQKVDEGIAHIDRQIEELAQPKAEYDFLTDQLSSLRSIEYLDAPTNLGAQAKAPYRAYRAVDRDTLGGEESDPQKVLALIAQYRQQGLITDITDSTVTFDTSKVQAQRKKLESLIEPLRGVQRRADLLANVKQRLDGYVTEGIYGSEQGEE